MQIAVITLMPAMFSALNHGVLGRAIEQQLVQIHLLNLREFATDKYQTVDDKPYGGGAGMVLKPEPLYAAIQAAKRLLSAEATVIALTPCGQRFDQAAASRLSQASKSLIIVCGRYEGIDQRLLDEAADACYSLGDFILSGGEFAAMAMIDAVARLLPNVLGNEASINQESFTSNRLEQPQYTRPEQFAGRSVPEVLLSGNHQAIAAWQQWQSVQRTQRLRPDLIARYPLTDAEQRVLAKQKVEN